MEDAGGERADAAGQHHVAQLADRRIRQHLLDVVLGHRDGRGQDRRGRSHHRHDVHGGRRQHVQEVHARDHVDAGRHHRRRVDQRADGRRAGHGVRQPDVQRDLRRLAGGAHEQQQADGGGRRGQHAGVGLQRAEAEQALARRQVRQHGDAQQEGADQEAEVADAVDHEGLLAGGGVGLLVEPEADQQVRTEPDALPADEEHEQVLAQDQRHHREDEQVQVGEEALVAVVVAHVAQRVDVDQEADARHDQRHDPAQRIQREAEIDMQGSEAQPRRDDVRQQPRLGRKRRQPQERHQRQHEREPHGAAGDGPHRRFGQAPVQQAVRRRPQQGQQHDPAQQALLDHGLGFGTVHGVTPSGS